jgi:phosphatidylglycerophosphate synthase
MSRVDKGRVRRIRNWQSHELYARLVMRPLAILVMLVIADWPWVTPNLLTTLANLCKLSAAGLVLSGHLVAGALLLQVGLLLDHLDGTLARYRGTSSSFGSYYDKVSDAFTWFPMHMAVGWLAYRQTGDALMLVLAAVGAYGLLVMGYTKWVLAAESERLAWEEAGAAADPGAVVRARIARAAARAQPGRLAAVVRLVAAPGREVRGGRPVPLGRRLPHLEPPPRLAALGAGDHADSGNVRHGRVAGLARP